MWKMNNINRLSAFKWRRNHTRKGWRRPTMMTTSPRRQKVSLLTTPSRILSTGEYFRTRLPASRKKLESQEPKMSSSICWIQSIVSKLISILNKRINLTMMKWSKNLYQNKFTTLAALRCLIL